MIPFDFVSKFDDGRYGQMVGDMIWKKLSAEGGFIVPESMLDVRDYCESHKCTRRPRWTWTKIKEDRARTISAGRSASGAASSGRPAEEGEVYDLVIKCVDFSAKPKPKVIYDVKARTKSVSEIPHLYVKADARRPGGREAGGPRRPHC